MIGLVKAVDWQLEKCEPIIINKTLLNRYLNKPIGELPHQQFLTDFILQINFACNRVVRHDKIIVVNLKDENKNESQVARYF